MGLFEVLQLAIIGLYLLASVLQIVGIAAGNSRLKGIAGLVTMVGFVIHSLDIGLLTVNQAEMVVLSEGSFYMSILAWGVMVVYFLLWWRYKLDFLATTALPLALILFITSLALGGVAVKLPPQFTMLFFWLHIGTLVLALGLCAMGFGAGLAFLHYNRKIKTKAGLASLGKDTPSLTIFDRVNGMAVGSGFPLYTLGIVSSYIWYWINPDKLFVWDIVKISSLAVWVAFAYVFHQRIILKWRGRKPAVGMVVVFSLMVVSLIHHALTFKP
ncbi:cytochrome c biogenesis protein CcsA [Desulfovibrio oxyclinae]|jgi:ABC-type transport system involved in cytochrome c biogenesis permease subunit|uniref:cytochrome c biogenesis protein CcsA n=1 Tax=Desulfovibrio oxyclinae TaxID=63560 RepID=UPI00037CA195|nr:cytochrome c biogenesis protein CcsA [Desulfovibrio oxyclinae]